jgi:hypothetical protein
MPDKPRFEYDPNNPLSFEEQYRQWCIIADTLVLDINQYPGTAAEQGHEPRRYNVVTKKGRHE